MLLSRLHYPVSNLGFGQRVGIWFQGCTVYCKGCIARDTWPADPNRECDVDDVLHYLRDIDGAIDGITISGGEPTDQPEALRELLLGIDRWRGRRMIDVLVYSGRTEQALRKRLPWLWKAADLLVSEPFERANLGEDALRGSSNQIVHRLTPLGTDRYPVESFEGDYRTQRGRIGVHVDADSIWLVGIPRPGDMARFRKELAERGIELTRTSWLT